jgi:hypothetical protein
MFLIRLRTTAAKLMKESWQKHVRKLSGRQTQSLRTRERERERDTHTHTYTCTQSDVPSLIQIDNMCTRITWACNIRVHQKSKRENTHRLSKKSLKRYVSKQLECNWKRGGTAAEEEENFMYTRTFYSEGLRFLSWLLMRSRDTSIAVTRYSTQ